MGKKKQAITSRNTKRQLKPAKYKSFRLHKRIKSPQPPIPSIYQLWKTALVQLKRQKWVFIGITIVYGLLVIVLVKGISGGLNVYELKENLNDALVGRGGAVASSLTVFSVLLGSASATEGELASLYQSIILVLVSLAYIWALRQTQSEVNQKTTVREAFYNGAAPVIPFVFVLVTISLQLLPIALANFFYSYVIGGGFAATPIEQGLWWLIIIVLILFSFYMISSSIFALYIVTLPGTKPMQALKAARNLVRYRRWTVLRKVIILPIVLVLLMALVTLPSIFLIPRFADWIFFVATLLTLPVLHSYMYGLYRSLL